MKQYAIFFLCLLIGACTLIFPGCIKVKPADPDPPGSVEPAGPTAPAEDDALPLFAAAAPPPPPSPEKSPKPEKSFEQGTLF